MLNSPSEGLLEFDELKAKGVEQLEMEMVGEIEVENIAVKDEESETVQLYVCF